MFTFPIMAVRKVIARGEEDAAANGGFRNPYYGIRPGEGEKPGFWLVGDEGVYIISNGKLTEGKTPLVVYSNECHPKGSDDWWILSAGISAEMTASSSSVPTSSFRASTGTPPRPISGSSSARTRSRSR